MIVVDSSAVISVLTREPGSDKIIAALDASNPRLISAGTLLELGIVCESKTDGRVPMERVVEQFALTVVPVEDQHLAAAMAGWRRFGKGRHPAGLNLGDCFAYALAITAGAPLLFVGDDFSRTGVRSALEEPTPR